MSLIVSLGRINLSHFKGKSLGVPEKVPFRMTADIVDGMGPSGTAGVFQRCAEETLRVLREESEVIMTVLEVFKLDPLHQWFVWLYFSVYNCSANFHCRCFLYANLALSAGQRASTK